MSPAAFAALLSAVCFVESGHVAGRITAEDHGSASYGECQIKIETARAMGFKGHPSDLLKREVNRQYAGRYLQYQLQRYERIDWAVSAYNRGSVRGGKINLPYVIKVFRAWGEGK